ncbi:hypothetical protein AQUCO_00201309v1 [Aquilegia coerulea]|uniref:Uncharacterized protein n=1 Tax=Aquilegia coerulea TaxID=218851 RepID=A0A2G5F7I5_AQUCA|nr:hypothetical protein AQUCO_00201309v1 [Aquilegia coerulea]
MHKQKQSHLNVCSYPLLEIIYTHCTQPKAIISGSPIRAQIKIKTTSLYQKGLWNSFKRKRIKVTWI